MHTIRPLQLGLPLVLSALAAAQSGSTRRANVDSAGAQAAGQTWGDTELSLSADGRLVAFASLAGNLVAGDTNGVQDVFVHDLVNGETTRVSVSSSGTQGNGQSFDPAISGDGRYVAFSSEANDLVPGDTNFTTDIFVHDLLTGTTERVSVDSSGQQAEPGLCSHPRISSDGRFVSFRSFADGLVPQDLNGIDDIFLRDRLLGTTTLVSIGEAGQQSTTNCGSADLSDDGRFVVFFSRSYGLVPGNVASTVYLKDLATGSLQLVDVDPAGNSVTISHSFDKFPTITDDGRYVSFRSNAPNLVAGDTNGLDDIFLRDLQTGQTTRVSVATSGAQANGASFVSRVSESGRWVAFDSQASNLVPGDSNGRFDVFLRDTWLETTTLVSVALPGGPANKDSLSPAVLPDASVVAFVSDATDHVVGDTNGFFDVFVRQLSGCSATVASYCTAATTSIPGCQAQLSGSGAPSVSAPAGFTVTAGPMPGGNLGVGYFGIGGPAALPFGSQGGLLCVMPPFTRTLPQATGGSTGACDGQMQFTLADLQALQPAQVVPGATVHIAAWFRDPPSADGFGVSAGLWFTLCP